MASKGRKQLPGTTVLDIAPSPAAVAEDMVTANQLIELQADYSENRDLANQLLGQAQLANSLSKFTQTVSTSKLAFVKENKLYRALKGKKIPLGAEFLLAAQRERAEKTPHSTEFLSGTWAEYCALLGRSEDQVDRDIVNLQAFGQEALESMSAMGIGYRELRQYRRLPEDQKLALIEVAKIGDKEGFVELAEEIIAKHAKEKEKSTEELEVKDAVLKKANERINNLEFELARKFKPNPDSVAQSEAEQALVNEINDATLAAHHAMRRTFMVADKALDGTSRESIELLARQAVEYLSQQLVDIAEQFSIVVDFESRLKPAWMSDEMLAAMESRNAALAAAEEDAKKIKASGKPKLASVATTSPAARH